MSIVENESSQTNSGETSDATINVASGSTSAAMNTEEQNLPQEHASLPKVDRQWILKILKNHSLSNSMQ